MLSNRAVTDRLQGATGYRRFHVRCGKCQGRPVDGGASVLIGTLKSLRMLVILIHVQLCELFFLTRYFVLVPFDMLLQHYIRHVSLQLCHMRKIFDALVI